MAPVHDRANAAREAVTEADSKDQAAAHSLQPVLTVVYRGIQSLLVAHGAALLALLTTYVPPDKVMPDLIRSFVVRFAVGFLAAVLAALGHALAELATLGVSHGERLDKRAQGTGMLVMSAGTVIALLALIETVMKVLFEL